MQLEEGFAGREDTEVEMRDDKYRTLMSIATRMSITIVTLPATYQGIRTGPFQMSLRYHITFLTDNQDRPADHNHLPVLLHHLSHPQSHNIPGQITSDNSSH